MNNEERAIWAGLYVLAGLWTKKDESILLLNEPDYPNDLAACFRDFVPKLMKLSAPDLDEITFIPIWGANGDRWECDIHFTDKTVIYSTGKDWAAALTCAVDTVIARP